MKKWNCNIVKDMYDRVIRRKFGLLCSDDTSNEAFLESYRNRLDCEVVDVSCYGDNEPCKESSTFTQCNISVTLEYNVQKKNFTFIANVTGGTAPYTYNWNFNPFIWNFVSQIGNTITLEAALPSTPSMGVSVNVEDSLGCKDSRAIRGGYLGGCTDPDAVNYNPNANYDNDSCYYEPLTLITGYTCNEFEAGDWCATVSGGVPPYTLVGIPNATIATDGGSYCEAILNGNPWNCYAIDSVGNVTPIQTGTIVCPFDCGSVTINPDVTIECLLDGLGNSTGQASVTVSPFGGTAPYIITISVNGGLPVTFVNGSIYNHDDNIEIFVVDANGCEGYFMEEISCPPTVPGGLFDDCEALANFLKDNASFAVQLIITDSGLNIGPGYYVDYQVNWISFIPSPLNTSNFPVVGVTIENNTTTNLTAQNGIAPFTGSGNPYTYSGHVVTLTQVNIRAEYSSTITCGPTLRAFVPGSRNLNLTVDLNFTVVLPGGLICNLCGTALLSLDYDPCEEPFTPISQTVPVSLIECLL